MSYRHLREACDKSYLKTATLFVNIPNSHVVLSALAGAPTMIRVSGNNGTRIVFSCTWKEKRKNEIDEVSIDMSKRGKRGPGPVVVSTTAETSVEIPGAVEGGGSSLILKLNPVLNKPTTAGANPPAVKSVENLIKVPELAMLRHLMITFEKHQKFATLSSKRPREKGNILVIGSRIAVGEANGGRNGRKRRVNEATVTAPSCRNSLLLDSFFMI